MIGLPSLIVLLIHISFLGCQQIKSPPQFVKQPPSDEIFFQVSKDDVDAETVQSIILECETLGEPPALYRWVKNGKDFNWQTYDDRILQQPGRGTLAITKPTSEDVGRYQCIAENELGIATSNSVSLRKAVFNSFKSSPPISVTGVEGEPFKLTCESPGGWPKPILQWLLYNDETGAMQSINNSRITSDPEGNLWFSNLTRDDSSNDFKYACGASYPGFTEYRLGNLVQLIVVASGLPPEFETSPLVAQYLSNELHVATRGNRVELFCIFGGTPLPEVTWSKNGQQISTSSRVALGNYGKSLVIRQTNFEDDGVYTCNASNGMDAAKSHSITLEVLAAPSFTEEPLSVNTAAGENVEFRCVASAKPEAHIKWLYNGRPIEDAPPNPRRKIAPNSIVIEAVEKGDIGNYCCNASNFLGYVYKDVSLNVLRSMVY